MLASHPRLADNPGLALQETFEQVDTSLGETSKENEQVYRYVLGRRVLPPPDTIAKIHYHACGDNLGAAFRQEVCRDEGFWCIAEKLAEVWLVFGFC